MKKGRSASSEAITPSNVVLRYVIIAILVFAMTCCEKNYFEVHVNPYFQIHKSRWIFILVLCHAGVLSIYIDRAKLGRCFLTLFFCKTARRAIVLITNTGILRFRAASSAQVRILRWSWTRGVLCLS
jgi:hypothetical protein